MNQLISRQNIVCCLLIFIHFRKHTTSAPVRPMIDDTSKSSSNSAHNLVYANFHPDLRNVNLAADLMTRAPRNYYFRGCPEKEYNQWYTQKYPVVCQIRFSTANTLKDLMAIYCDHHCGDIYLSYMRKCAMQTANHYRKLCSEFKVYN
jgi:hypothetical protein